MEMKTNITTFTKGKLNINIYYLCNYKYTLYHNILPYQLSKTIVKERLQYYCIRGSNLHLRTLLLPIILLLYLLLCY